MKLFEGITEKNYFSELIRIEDFSTVEEVLDKINRHYLDEDDDCLFETNDVDKEFYTYCYLSGDGQVYFVESLDEFSRDRRSEEEWGVDIWREII